MARIIRDIQSDQDLLRKRLYFAVRDKDISMLQLSKDMNIPYSTIRSFLMGHYVYFKNVLKIEKWLEINQSSH